MPITVRQRSLQTKNGPKKIPSNQKISKKGGIWKSTKKNGDSDMMITNAPTDLKSIYFPSTKKTFCILLTVRICAAIWSHITDCDETYNYWEPLHYLVYGNGLQTWEYSPAYAIRSYASLWLFAAPARLLDSFHLKQVYIFYILRVILALGTSFSEALFYKAICHEFGVHVGRMWLAFSVTSAGGFICSAAMLPSSWCAALTACALASWWLNKLYFAVFFVALSALFGWPFAALAGLPIALDTVRNKLPSKIWEFALASVLSLAIILPPLITSDTWHYGKLVVAPWNIVYYNIFTSHGPDLYGVEPVSFYFVNGFLNFNVIWVLALLCPILLGVCSLIITEAKPRLQFCRPYWLSLMPLYLWLLVFMKQPHKEERFLFPVYCMIPLCGAISVDCIQKVNFTLKQRFIKLMDRCFTKKKLVNIMGSKRTHYLAHTNYIMAAFVFVAMLGGSSRILALYKNYHAPMEIFDKLDYFQTDLKQVNVCFGAEWYRSPSSFLLPDQRYRIRFIKSEFGGQMPVPYGDDVNATRTIHPYFNDQNKEDVSTYLQPSECHYLVHSDITEVTPLQPAFHNQTDQWQIVDSRPFLNAEASDRLFRAFYVPCLNSNYTVYGNMYLLRNVKFKDAFKVKS